MLDRRTTGIDLRTLRETMKVVEKSGKALGRTQYRAARRDATSYPLRQCGAARAASENRASQSLKRGSSDNDIDTAFWDGSFDTTRWMADTSLEGQWNLDEATTITPKLRIVYFSESVDDYAVKNDAGDTVAIDGFDQEQFRVSLGAEIARSFTLESGTQVTPKLGVTGGYSGLDGSGAFGSLTAGVALQTTDMWMLDLSLLLNVAESGETSTGGRIKAAKQF